MADNAEDFSNKSSDHICYDLVHYESNLHEVSKYHQPVVRALMYLFLVLLDCLKEFVFIELQAK